MYLSLLNLSSADLHITKTPIDLLLIPFPVFAACGTDGVGSVGGGHK